MSYLAAACTAWHTQPATPESALAVPAKIARISLIDGSVLTVREPRVRSDSLFGLDANDQSRHIALPLASVRTVDFPEPSVGRSVALMAGIALALAAVGFIAIVAALPKS
jgi:hypothetical protein